MPFYWRPYRRRFPRYRRYWTRRFRTSFRRRRFWRKRQYRVRKKKKITKLTIKQWQPNTIRKLTIKGQYPLFAGTTERIGNDYVTYIDSVAPHDFPGGGLFSIIIFTLNGLYELHQKGRNWWTKSNCNLPLIRYLGCSIKLYASSSVDYVSVPIRCGDLKATEETFQSCQPSVLMLNKRKKVVQCRSYKHAKRPYKRMYIKPPALLLNKWYFQRDIARYPLLMLLSSAASLERYFLPASSISETIGFDCLNTSFFIRHDFKTKGTEPYIPNDQFALFAVNGQYTDPGEQTFDKAILLGNTKDYTRGIPITEKPTSDKTWSQIVDTYLSKPTNWGNPFIPFYFGAEEDEKRLWLFPLKGKSLTQALKEETITATTKIKEKMQTPTKPFTVHCRYNPQQDMGHNAIFLTRILNDKTEWHKPADEKILSQGYPLWLMFWGWHDYQQKAHNVQGLDTDYINVIVSDYIHPTPKDQNITYFVPLDWFFLNNRSPYAQKDEIKGYDLQNWHPKANFQIQSISHILQSGPATAKLPPMISAEAHITYRFHFKVGGCPPQMDEVCDPNKQPYFPQPGNLLSSILLQNPEYPIQHYISSFDQRRDMLTTRAAKRLKEDTPFKESIFKPTGHTLLEVQTKTPQDSSEETSEEESEETIQNQLQQHKRKQRKLQHRILQLLTQIQNI